MDSAHASASVPYDLLLVGGGNMGSALLGGLLESGSVDASAVAVAELDADRRVDLARRFPGVTVTAELPMCRGAVLAVKPDGAAAVAAAAVTAGATRLLSIAAGVRLDTLTAAAGDGAAVLRAMPNTPALVRRGTTALCGAAGVTEHDFAWAERVLGAVGIVERLPESLFDLFTGLAGSGPAYLFLVAEALTEVAVAEGLEPDRAERIVGELLVGSSLLLAREGDPATLRAKVTSPGGTTAAGVAVLEDRDLRGTVIAAVRAAAGRSRELG
jgi:pyrroline-5-carboxylate reductase